MLSGIHLAELEKLLYNEARQAFNLQIDIPRRLDLNMEISLDIIKDKVECLQAYDFHELARAIEERIEINKALMLRVKQVQHQVTFDPIRTKMLYSAVVHFALD